LDMASRRNRSGVQQNQEQESAEHHLGKLLCLWLQL
jgi:hypothetical protein